MLRYEHVMCHAVLGSSLELIVYEQLSRQDRDSPRNGTYFVSPKFHPFS